MGHQLEGHTAIYEELKVRRIDPRSYSRNSGTSHDPPLIRAIAKSLKKDLITSARMTRIDHVLRYLSFLISIMINDENNKSFRSCQNY
jgi:hypothetical protein